MQNFSSDGRLIDAMK